MARNTGRGSQNASKVLVETTWIKNYNTPHFTKAKSRGGSFGKKDSWLRRIIMSYR